MTLHILCAVRDAAPFIAECLDSVRAQSHGEWVMLLRDDGSRDDSAQIIARYAQDDPRIQLVQRSPTSIGAAAGYFSLLQLVPDGAARDVLSRDAAALTVDPENVPAIAEAIAMLVRGWMNGTLPQGDATTRAPYERRRLTEALAGHLDDLVTSLCLPE